MDKEVLASCVCMDNLVLRSIEDSIVHRQHGCDSEDLFRALEPKNHKSNLLVEQQKLKMNVAFRRICFGMISSNLGA